MPVFACSKCNCIENTALSNYWWNVHEEGRDPLCSECDPEIAKWHGQFDKKPASGFNVGEDGFLYSPDEKPSHTKIVGAVE